MRNRNTVEFLAVWEELHNPDFNRVQFEAVRSEAGLNRFVMTPTKWIEQTNAIGIVSKAGRYGGGTYAHSDIAMAFATWISPEFQLYIMKDYRRLKQDENSRFSLDWNLNRALSKVNYRIHTDAVKENLIPPELTPEQIAYTYASEADLLNVALFGQTAKQRDLRRRLSMERLFTLNVEEDGKYDFKPSKYPYISVYFPTETESKLKFIVQGPYRTTPNRSSVPADDKDNIELAMATVLSRMQRHGSRLKKVQQRPHRLWYNFLSYILYRL